jgi:large repetitive protein
MKAVVAVVSGMASASRRLVIARTRSRLGPMAFALKAKVSSVRSWLRMLMTLTAIMAALPAVRTICLGLSGPAAPSGDRDPATGRLSQKFESEGITFGGDYRFSPSFAAGVGAGLGRDTVDIGDKGSRSKGEAKTIAIYGSHQLGSGIYFDWLGGYQALDFDLRRYVTPTGALVNSSRSGRQWFATASTGADIETGNWLITPYARMDMTLGRLKGYTENSGSLFDLSFLDQDVDFTSLGLGTRINYRHIFKGGALLPRLRIEYQYDLERNSVARVAYFDRISGPFSTVPLSGLEREQLMLGAGVELHLEAALAFEIEYLNRIAPSSGSDQSVQIGVKLKF